MKRPLCRLISVALIVLCSIETSNAKNRHAGVHTGPHWSSTTMYETSDASPAVEAKASKPAKPVMPEKHHAGNGGKHDTGVDGKHPVNTISSKAGKPATTPSTPATMSMWTPATWESPALHTTTHHTTTKQTDSKSGKTSGTHMPAASMSLSYAKSQKIASDSKADKGDENAKSYKPAPNEYHGVKMVVKTPEGGYKQPKSGKEPHNSDGGSSSASTTLPETEGNTTIVSTTVPPAEIPDIVGTTTTEATEAATPAAATTTEAAVQKAPKKPDKRIEESSPDEPVVTPSPTYSPTALAEEQTSSVEETFTAMEPFGLRFLSSKQQPSFNLDTVTEVTTEHLLHSFRTKGWDADRLKLMLLDDEGRRRSLRKLDSFPVHELVFGGILYFKTTTEMPTKEEENALVEESFSGARLNYFVNLLKEEGVDVASASWGHLATSNEPTGGSGSKLGIILGSVFGSIALFIVIALLVRVYNKRERRIHLGTRLESATALLLPTILSYSILYLRPDPQAIKYIHILKDRLAVFSFVMVHATEVYASYAGGRAPVSVLSRHHIRARK